MANNNLEVSEVESKQYIVVMVGDEHYGIDIGYIDNIVRMQKNYTCAKSTGLFPRRNQSAW